MLDWLRAWLGNGIRGIKGINISIPIRFTRAEWDSCDVCGATRKDHLSKTHPFMEDME